MNGAKHLVVALMLHAILHRTSGSERMELPAVNEWIIGAALINGSP
jgi:hypothetical protein